MFLLFITIIYNDVTNDLFFNYPEKKIIKCLSMIADIVDSIADFKFVEQRA